MSHKMLSGEKPLPLSQIRSAWPYQIPGRQRIVPDEVWTSIKLQLGGKMGNESEQLPQWAESPKTIQHFTVKEVTLPNGDLSILAETIVRPPKPAQVTISPEVIRKRVMLEIQGAFKKVFVDDWKMSERMGELVWADVEKELGK